jgi:cell division protease FtsH
VAHHEAGHAIVGARLSPEAPVRKISIIPRGFGALGYTLQLPLEDRYLATREELCQKLAVLLGGRSAEEVLFGSVSTGAADDLRRATDLASRMVREFGMSERLGPLAFEREPASPLLNGRGAGGRPRDYGDRTAEAIDEEIRALVDAAHARAREVLEKERPLLEQLAGRLLEREVLEGEELRTLLAPPPPTQTEGLRAAAGA